MNVDRSKERKWFHTRINKMIFRRNYSDDMELLANTPTQAKSLLHCLEQAVGGIGLYVNANKTELVRFNREYISMQNGGPLKLIDKFMYLCSNVSSTESDVNLHQAKVRTAIDRLSIILKSGLSDKFKRYFF